MSPPSKLDQAKSLGKAAISLARYGKADRPTWRARMESCSACEQLRGTRCKLCGCFVAVKSKLKRPPDMCDKWKALECTE